MIISFFFGQEIAKDKVKLKRSLPFLFPIKAVVFNNGFSISPLIAFLMSIEYFVSSDFRQSIVRITSFIGHLFEEDISGQTAFVVRSPPSIHAVAGNE